MLVEDLGELRGRGVRPRRWRLYVAWQDGRRASLGALGPRFVASDGLGSVASDF